MSPLLSEMSFWESLLNQSPVLAVFVVMSGILFTRMSAQHAENIKTKDDEINRLAAEKKWLQERLYGEPLLTTEPKSPEEKEEKEPKDTKDQKTEEKPPAEKPKAIEPSGGKPKAQPAPKSRKRGDKK